MNKLAFSNRDRDEGLIKFKINHEFKATFVSPEDLVQIDCLDRARTTLKKFKVLGQYSDGISFGNLSIRDKYNKEYFIISGTSSGHLNKTSVKDYARVISADIPQNTVNSQGLTKASSESMSHSAVYANAEISCVIHGHNQEIYNKLASRSDKTGSNTAYGTVEMADEIKKICSKKNIGSLIMEGHEHGFMLYGPSLDSTLKMLADTIQQKDLDLC